MEWFRTQLTQVLRRLSRAPLFTAVTLLTLAAAIGANTAVFSVLESVLLKPLPYPKADELVTVSHSAPGMNIKDLVTTGPANYFIYRDQNTAFQDIGMYIADSVSVTGKAEPERVSALRVTDGMISILGVSPALGRQFNRQDDAPSSPDTAMLTYGYWQRKFGGDPSIAGKTIQVDGKAMEIIAVLPQNFHFLAEADPAVILPVQFDRAKTNLAGFVYHAIARLKPGRTVADANADVARMIPIVLRSFPMPQGYSITLFEGAHFGPLVRPVKQDVVGDVGKALWVLMGSIGMVLLIACANVANLLLVRIEGRRQELAIRTALGASWRQIASELLFESGVLGFIGSALGLGLAFVLLRALVGMAPKGLPRIHEIGIDGPVLLFTLGLSLLAGLLVGSIPILKYARTQLSAGLREGGRGQSQGRQQHRARNVLVVVQVALALVLLVCSGLMVRTFIALTHVQPGFAAPAELQTFSLFVPNSEVPEAERVTRLYEEVLQRVSAVPGVTSAGLSATIPMDGREEGIGDEPLYAEDHNYQSGQLPPLRRFKTISPGFLAAMGTPLVAGRDFTWADTFDQTQKVLVSEKLARELWQDPSAALGKRVREGEAYKWQEVIGVVADVHDDGVNKEPPSSLYWPIVRSDLGERARPARSLTLAIRSLRAGTESLMKDLSRAVWSVDSNLPLANVRTADYFVNRSLARTSFTLMMLGIAGGMALLLGSVGVYGVIAYSVSQRTREIGIRMALGAQSLQLTAMFVRYGLLLTAIGIACGFGVAATLSRVLSSLLFKVSPLDPATYAAVALGLIATALFASYLPSRRAARVDPIEALRSE
ncbi:MAG: ABC transporter permease [Candidatus Acidiferrales bacterium]